MSVIRSANQGTRSHTRPTSPSVPVGFPSRPARLISRQTWVGVYDLTRLVIVFAGDTIQNYTLSVSTNGSGYTQIASGVTNNTQVQSVTITSFSNTPKGRYLRITGLDRWNSSYGNSIWEVAAYGTVDNSFPVGSITNFDAVAVSNTQVNLTWNYSGSTLTNYTLRRNGNVIASPAAGATSHPDTGLTAGTSYTYTLTGNYAAGGTTNTATDSVTTTGGSTGTWLSGASCVGAADGTFAAWRGTPATFATTWSDNSYDNAVNAYQFWSGFDFENWDKSADWACGAIWSGDSWAGAASGSMDAKWTAILDNIKNRWTAKPRGTCYIRFAHEMNGSWFPWSVNAANINNFKAAWIRFRNLQTSIFPAAKMVFGTNGNTSGQSYDWRLLWPGDQYVDVYSTDGMAAITRFPSSTAMASIVMVARRDCSSIANSPSTTAYRSVFPNGASTTLTARATIRIISSTCMIFARPTAVLVQAICFTRRTSTSVPAIATTSNCSTLVKATPAAIQTLRRDTYSCFKYLSIQSYNQICL